MKNIEKNAEGTIYDSKCMEYIGKENSYKVENIMSKADFLAYIF